MPNGITTGKYRIFGKPEKFLLPGGVYVIICPKPAYAQNKPRTASKYPKEELCEAKFRHRDNQ
jgi:hypothetical protein